MRNEIRQWRYYWREVARMWREQQGIVLKNFLNASFPVALISLFFLLYGVFKSNEAWQITLSAIFLSISVGTLLFTLLFTVPYKKWKEDTERLQNRINKLYPLQELESQQRGKEAGWLHLVVEKIDLGRRMNRAEKEITVSFQVDSGLAYDFQPFGMKVSPILDGLEPMESQKDVNPVPNLLKGQRSQRPSIVITVKDDKLWECVQKARRGEDVTKALKLEIQCHANETFTVLRSEPTYSDRANDCTKV